MKKQEINIGDVFGRWTVINNDYIIKNSHRCYLCRCSCDAHTEKYVDEFNLKKGKSLSCGCLSKESARTRMKKHGKSHKSKLYNVWTSMRERCNCKTDTSYQRYGGRGISICKEWDDFQVFEEWAVKNGYDENAPKGTYTLDRINVNGNYEPNNCRWISLSEQSDNKTNTIWLTYNGKTQTLLQWSKELGMPSKLLRNRYYDRWPVDRIFQPIVEKVGKNYIEYKGEIHTLSYWSQKLNLPYTTMWRRYVKGYPLDIVFSKEPLKKCLEKKGG